MLKTRIKASSVTNLTDARYFAAWDVTWLGFCLDTAHPNYLDAMTINAIKEWVEGPTIVGEFGNQSSEEIVTAIESIGLEAVQLSSSQQLHELKLLTELPILLELHVDTLDQLDSIISRGHELAEEVFLFVLKFTDQEALNQLNEDPSMSQKLTDFCHLHPTLLDLEIAPQQIVPLIDNIKPYGLNFTGGAEEKVGYKSFEELDDLFEAIEVF